MGSGKGTHWLIESTTIFNIRVSRFSDIFVNFALNHSHSAVIYTINGQLACVDTSPVSSAVLHLDSLSQFWFTLRWVGELSNFISQSSCLFVSLDVTLAHAYQCIVILPVSRYIAGTFLRHTYLTYRYILYILFVHLKLSKMS